MPKLLDDIVSTKGSEIAVADEFGSTTWSQFDERVRRLMHQPMISSLNLSAHFTFRSLSMKSSKLP